MPTAPNVECKSPSETRVIGMQFAQALERDETLESITIVVYKVGTISRRGDLTAQTPASTSELTALPADIGGAGIHTDRQVNLLLAGGVAGTRYMVEVRATSSSGEVVPGFAYVDVRL